MKTYDEIKAMMDAAKVAAEKAKIDALHESVRKHHEEINNFVDSLMKKYESLIEDDLTNHGVTRFELYTDGFHFKNGHVVDPGNLPAYDCIVEIRNRFIKNGFKEYMISFSADSIQVSIH